MNILACDLDGTILNENQELSKTTISALEKIKNLGVDIVLASGRHPMIMLKYHQELNLSNPMIACNGSCIYDPNKSIFLYEGCFDLNVAQNIIDVCNNLEIIFTIEHSQGISFSQKTTQIESGIKKYPQRKFNWYLYKNLEELLKQEIKIYKFFLHTKNSDETKHTEDIIKKCNNFNVSLTSSEDYGLDIVPNNLNKWKGIQSFFDIANTKKKLIFAIGDNTNDIEMIKNADIGIAMGNATDEVKECSDFITQTNLKEGIPQAIEYILNKTNL